MEERKTSRQLQAENTKKRILDTVTEILKTESYDKMSILEICQKTGISVGAFYHHFENKAALIVELYRDLDEFFTYEVYEKVKDMPPLEAVETFLQEQCRYAVRMGFETSSNVFKAQIDNGNEFFISKDRGIAKCLLTLLERLRAEGIVMAATDSVKLRDDILIITRGIIYNWCLAGGKTDMDAQVSSIVLSYIKAFG